MQRRMVFVPHHFKFTAKAAAVLGQIFIDRIMQSSCPAIENKRFGFIGGYFFTGLCDQSVLPFFNLLYHSLALFQFSLTFLMASDSSFKLILCILELSHPAFQRGD